MKKGVERVGTERGMKGSGMREGGGASGQKEARIICHDLQAELVSIAGNYWLSDQIESEFWQQKVMLSMNDDSLLFESLAI